MSKEPPPAPTASAKGPCPTIIQTSRTPRHWKFIQDIALQLMVLVGLFLSMDAFCCRHDVPGDICVCVCVQFCQFYKADAATDVRDTAIADRRSGTTIFQLRAQWVH